MGKKHNSAMVVGKDDFDERGSTNSTTTVIKIAQELYFRFLTIYFTIERNKICISIKIYYTNVNKFSI